MLPNSDRAFRDELYRFWESLSPDAKRSDSFQMLKHLVVDELGFDTESRVVSKYSKSTSSTPKVPKAKKKDSGIGKLVASLSARVANLSTLHATHYLILAGGGAARLRARLRLLQLDVPLHQR